MNTEIEIARRLFGKDTKEVCVKVLPMLISEPIEPRTPHGILEHCKCVGSWGDVANIFVAAAMREPRLSHGLLVEMQALYFSESVGVRNPQFPLGALLGIFESAVWLDINVVEETEFCKRLAVVIPEMIFCKNDLLKTTSFLPAGLPGGYEDRLSKAIKFYVGGEPAKRMARINQIEKTIPEIMRRHKELEKRRGGVYIIPTLGTIVLDNLTYGLFKHMSPIARAAAIGLFVDYIDS